MDLFNPPMEFNYEIMTEDIDIEKLEKKQFKNFTMFILLQMNIKYSFEYCS